MDQAPAVLRNKSKVLAGDTITAASTDADTDTASSSSGGGGGSASTAAAGQYSQQVWDSINKGDVATITVKDDALGITKIEFNVVEKVWGAWLKVTQKKNCQTMSSLLLKIFTKNWR